MSYIKPKRVFLILFVLIIIFCQFIVLSDAAQTLTAAQRAEIAKLRSELTTAFEKDEEKQLQAAVQQGVIVQPIWTQGGNSNAGKADQGKVVVTDKDLFEAKALRAEINKAVSKNQYVVAAPNEADAVRKVEAELTKKGSSQTKSGAQVGIAATDTMLGMAKNNNNNNAAEMNIPNEPNVVEANAAIYEPDIDVRKLQRLEVSKRRTRELLVLAHIEEDFSFNLGDDVKAWQLIVHNGSEFFIGQREHDLLFIRQEQQPQTDGVKRYAPIQTLSIALPISYLTCYQFWNRAHEVQEGVVLIAMADQVHWYRYDDAQGQFIDDWQWFVGTAVTGLTHFTIDEHHYLVVSSNQSMRTGYYALNIYEYDLTAKEFWLAQRMQLANASAEVTILDTGRDILLTVPQTNIALIYAFNPRETISPGHVHFQLRHSIASEGIDHASAFQMGGRSYLALGGLKPQILQYAQGALQPKTILSHNFGLVELFMPVPVRTYRDDLLLLVQHRVDFSTHTLVVLDVLIWNGEAFEASIPVPCQLGEHIAYGVSCMLDIHRDAGLRGAALLGRGRTPLLIVPRHSAESGLFRLHTELLAKNSELVDLQEIWAFLKDWVLEQDTLIAQAQEFLAAPAPRPTSGNELPYDTVITPELIYDGSFDELLINDYKWTTDDMTANIHDILSEIRVFEQELRQGYSDDNSDERHARHALDMQNFSYESLDFDEVNVDELFVAQVNHMPFYIQNGTLSFDGLLNVRDLLVLDELLTDAPLQNYATTLKLDGDLFFERINGLVWSTFAEQLVMRNQPLSLERLVVKGEVIAEDSLHIDVLNGNTFPADYLWSHSDTTSIIRAPKEFTGILSVNAIDMVGTINGANPLDVITLSEPQDWSGTPTFAKLEVAELLELNGTAQGRNFEQAPENPTLLETRELNADCTFSELIVNGALRLKGTFDGIAIDALLDDIVQRAPDAAQALDIAAPKEFSSVSMPVDLQIGDAALSGIDIDDFVTTHTAQTLQQLSAIDGYVFFNELQLTGTYDGVDLAQLLREAIHLDAPVEAPSTQLNFVHALNSTATVEVKSLLNDARLPNDYQTLYEDLHLPVAQFEHIEATEAHINGGIVGAALLNGKRLHDFLTLRDWQTPGSAGNIFLHELVLPHGLQADKVQGINASLLLDFLDQIDELPLMIFNGQIEVEQLHVRGVTLVKTINGKDFDADIQRRVIWLNRPNYLSNTLTFMDDVELASDLNVLGSYNARNMPDFMEDIVFRNETLNIAATKKFMSDVRVVGATRLLAINGVPFEYIANTRRSQHFYGNLSVHGGLQVTDLAIEGALNDLEMTTLTKKLRFEPERGVFVQLGDVAFTTPQYYDDLTVFGRLRNATPPLAAYFKDIIYKHEPFGNITGAKTFTGRVTITNGAHIEMLNELNVKSLLENVVLVNEAIGVAIHTPVVFEALVRTHRALVYGTLSTPSLANCQLNEWLSETIRVDRSLSFANKLFFSNGALNGNNLTIGRLNDVDMTQLITLYTPQNLSTATVLFNELHLVAGGEHDPAWLNVQNGRVNGIDLLAAYEDTLFTTSQAAQTVRTPLIMKSIKVLGDLRTNAPINGEYDLRYLAPLDAPRLTIESPLYFQQLDASDVRTSSASALISGIDFNAWHANTLWADRRAVQRITGNWSVRNLHVKQDAGTNQPQPQPQRMQRQPQMRACVENKPVADATTTGYHIKYLALDASIILNETLRHETPIRRGFMLNGPDGHGNNSTFVLANAGCWSIIYKWQPTKASFSLLTSFKSGPVDAVQTVSGNKSTDVLQFITSYKDDDHEDDGEPVINCTQPDIRAWRMASDEEDGDDEGEVLSVNLTLVELKARRSLFELFWQRAASPFLMFNARAAQLQQQQQQQYERQTIKILKHPTTTTILRPQINDRNNFTFDDFRAVIVRIIIDLNERLDTEMNITQLSIPESDLYHEQLYEDFRSVMHELRAQRIYPNVTFMDLATRRQKLPNNPAQVLAARAVQIIWPVIVEIEEIHGYLWLNETHAHPLCDRLKTQLGEMVRDVLELAYHEPRAIKAKTKAQQRLLKQHQDTKSLHAIIERIRIFQADLNSLSKQMDAVANESEKAAMAVKRATDIVEARNVLMAAAMHINVGPDAQPQKLVVELDRRAVNEDEDATAAHMQQQHDAVRIYHANGQLYQTLPAQRPSQLNALRIRDATLLAFVEGCCHVRVLRYRGVQGFVDFADFETATKIVKLWPLELPTLRSAGGIYYGFAVALPNELQVYEVVVALAKRTEAAAEAGCE